MVAGTGGKADESIAPLNLNSNCSYPSVRRGFLINPSREIPGKISKQFDSFASSRFGQVQRLGMSSLALTPSAVDDLS